MMATEDFCAGVTLVGKLDCQDRKAKQDSLIGDIGTVGFAWAIFEAIVDTGKLRTGCDNQTDLSQGITGAVCDYTTLSCSVCALIKIEISA